MLGCGLASAALASIELRGLHKVPRVLGNSICHVGNKFFSRGPTFTYETVTEATVANQSNGSNAANRVISATRVEALILDNIMSCFQRPHGVMLLFHRVGG